MCTIFFIVINQLGKYGVAIRYFFWLSSVCENCHDWSEPFNLPGGEDLRAAHGMTQVAHRTIFRIILPRKFDV